ncbi:hypothetical protein K438DRAFT_1592707 [Mycena galopus ATCC 62051]|nr:hypothetical protein K438DRAFT_1592707 [Mycena galopus ATCC 62051]
MPAPAPYPSSNVYACARTVPLPRMCMPALAPYPFLECVRPHSHCTPSSNTPAPAWYPLL